MKILIAEDDWSLAQAYKDALESRNHEIVLTANGEECLKRYHERYQDEVHQHAHAHHSSHRVSESNKKTGNKSKEDHNKGKFGVPFAFDVVILDYIMPKKNGLQVAKEIFELNPDQRIIFASAYAKDTLIDSVRHLKRVVELLQKPFGLQQLIDTVEDKEAYEALNNLIVNIRSIKDPNPSNEEVKKLFENLRRIQKYRTY
jgi:CheY-like chemotaxis protein